jgi:hypothetical protein
MEISQKMLGIIDRERLGEYPELTQVPLIERDDHIWYDTL